MDKNIVNIKSIVELKREKLNELILNKVEYDLILKQGTELDKLINIYNEYLVWNYDKGVDAQKDINYGN